MFDRSQYSSYANDTKWSELRHAMVSLYPRAARFRVKKLNWPNEGPWDGEWFYHFKLDYDWKEMEFVELQPTTCADAVSLNEIATICQRIGLEIERDNECIRVIGYRKST